MIKLNNCQNKKKTIIFNNNIFIYKNFIDLIYIMLKKH